MASSKNNNLKKDEHISQIVSWGHWFTLINIAIVIIIGFQYAIIADWPETFLGGTYSILSTVGHFSFLCFFVYLILLFPFSFFIHSVRWQKIIATILATVGMAILFVDLSIFSHFRMHLSFSIWSVLTSSNEQFLNKPLIALPFVLVIETLLGIWIWKKLRSLNKLKYYAKVIVSLLTLSFVLSHLIYIWADANFYRSITMQKSNLPLSYPMTARHLLSKYGFINQQHYQSRLAEEGNPSAIAIDYPIGKIKFNQQAAPMNIILIIIDGWNNMLLNDNMPFIKKFATDNIEFAHHYAASNQPNLNNFSLFYGLDTNYYNSILASHEPSALLDTISSQHYNLGLFSSNNFDNPLYRRALFSNFTFPDEKLKGPSSITNQETTNYWLTWFRQQSEVNNHAPFFSIIHYSLVRQNETVTLTDLSAKATHIDKYIESIIASIEAAELSENTIVVITGTNGLKIDQMAKTVSYDDKNNFSRSSLHVPLIVAWPNQPAQKVAVETSHTDIMSTLMQQGLHVTSALDKYSQGKNLFSLNNDGGRQWIIAGNEDKIAVLNQDKTIIINQFGHVDIYDKNNRLMKDEQINLALFLQVLNQNRRFMINRSQIKLII